MTRPCPRNLDRPLIALWGLEPGDLVAVLGLVGLLALCSNIGVGLVGGLLGLLALKGMKAGKPRGHVFHLFYRTGLLRLVPASLRPPYLVRPPWPGERLISFSAAPGPEDDLAPETRSYHGGRERFR